MKAFVNHFQVHHSTQLFNGDKRGGYDKDMHIPGPEVVASVVSYICKPEAYFITGKDLI